MILDSLAGSYVGLAMHRGTSITWAGGATAPEGDARRPAAEDTRARASGWHLTRATSARDHLLPDLPRDDWSNARSPTRASRICERLERDD